MMKHKVNFAEGEREGALGREVLKITENGELWLGRERLHCGDVIDVLVQGEERFIRTRVEMDVNDDWYFADVPDAAVDGCAAEPVR